MEKELKIVPPEGYEIDKENSTFECIKFKPIKPTRWRDSERARITGYFIGNASDIVNIDMIRHNSKINYNVFATEKQAKSALAMARISQIIANDKRFGGPITNEEWNSRIDKYIIIRFDSDIIKVIDTQRYSFLAFHTKEQRNLFLEENEDLIKDYFML